MGLMLAMLPVVLLVVLMTSPWPRGRLPLAAHVALPAVAALAYALHLGGVYGAVGGRRVHAAAIDGVLSSLTPLAIVFGAVLFFKTMELSGAMGVLTRRLRSLSPDPVAQLVLVGWAFSFLVEGLSGFGTPAALAAPILVGLGFPAVRVAAMCLAMNSVPVSFGAVGTPIWFGLGELGLGPGELRAVGVRAAAVNSVAALVVPVAALCIVVPWREVRARLRFVLTVVLATVLPYFAASFWSVEFPSIIGGVCGVGAGAAAARFGLGLPRTERPAASGERGAFRAAAPVAAVVVLLAVTRINALGIGGLLNWDASAATVGLEGVGEAWVSPALVVGVRGILGTEASWRMAVLHVPFIVPFVLVSLLAWPLLGMKRATAGEVVGRSVRRLGRPALALVGALVLVKMLMLGGEASPAMVMGHAMADAAGSAWPPLAPLLGALGAFFSGSNTVSNLTFAPVQAAIAQRLGLDAPSMLALQTVGGAMGNMICIHNIVAVAAVLGLPDKPGPGEPGTVAAVLRRTIGAMLLYAVVAAAGALALPAFSG